MNGILSVSSFCEVCSAVSRSISWARCLPVCKDQVVGEKFVFDEAYEEVGVARSHFGSHCNTVDFFVVVVTTETKNS